MSAITAACVSFADMRQQVKVMTVLHMRAWGQLSASRPVHPIKGSVGAKPLSSSILRVKRASAQPNT